MLVSSLYLWRTAVVLGSNMKNYLFWKELMRRHSFEGRIILQLWIEVYYKVIIRIDEWEKEELGRVLGWKEKINSCIELD
jgi:hypothetical protein